MKLAKRYIKQIIKEELKYLTEANVDPRTGQPLDTAAWKEKGSEFLDTPFGKQWAMAHKNNGGKYNTQTGEPIGGIANVPPQTWYTLHDMSKIYSSAQNLNQQAQANQKAATEKIAATKNYYDNQIAAVRGDSASKIAATNQQAQGQAGNQQVDPQYDEELKKAEAEVAAQQKEAAEAAKAMYNAGIGKIVKSVEDDLAKTQQELDATYASLRDEFGFNKQLKDALQKAPDRPSPLQLKVYEEIVTPYNNKTDDIMNQIDNIDQPGQLQDFLKNEWRPHVKQVRQVMRQFFEKVKAGGQLVSKGFIEIMIKSSDTKLELIRNEVKWFVQRKQNLQQQAEQYKSKMK